MWPLTDNEPAGTHYRLISVVLSITIRPLQLKEPVLSDSEGGHGPLTSHVLRGRGHSASLEEGVCVRVHHQQSGLITTSLDGSNDV